MTNREPQDSFGYYSAPDSINDYGQPPELGYYASMPELSAYAAPPDMAYYADPASAYAGYAAGPDFAGYADFGDPYADAGLPPELTGWNGYGWYGGPDPAMGYYASPDLNEYAGYYASPDLNEYAGYADYAMGAQAPEVAGYSAADYSGYVQESADNFNACCHPPTAMHGMANAPVEGYVEPHSVNPIVDDFVPPPNSASELPQTFRPLW